MTVRESQAAVFVNEGVIADVFTPGRYTLSTENMPVLTKLKSWKYGFNSPFKAEVYFVNTKQFTDQKWGTSNPIMMRDAEFGMLRLRAYGIYSYRVSDPVKFLKEIFGTNASYDTTSIEGQLKRTIVSGLSDMFAEAKIPALDLAMYYDELSEQGKKKMMPKFNDFGFSITSLLIENISLPEEVEKVLDKRTSMGVSEKVSCTHCGASVNKASKFCSECGKPMEEPKHKCIKCNADINKGSKFCPECGASQSLERKCPSCGHKVSPNSKFCPECGTKVE